MHILQYFEIIIIIFKLKLRNTSPLYRSSLQGSLQKSVHRQISQNTDLVYKQIPILKPVQDGQNRKLTFSSVSWSRKKHPQETSPREVCCVMQHHIRKVELLLAPSLLKLHHMGRLKNYLRNNPAVITPLPRTVLYGVLLIRALALTALKHVLNKDERIELCLLSGYRNCAGVCCFQRQRGKN